MKIGLIGPGIMPIPPTGWGAVEMLIWDYYNILIKHGYEVEVINTPNRDEIVNVVNNGNFDVVHLHYDVFIDVVPRLKNTKIIVSSHFPFINNPEKYGNYRNIFNQLVKNDTHHLFASSLKDINTYISNGADNDKVFLSKLGVKSDVYNFNEVAELDKTICFSQIINRKRQFLIQDIDGIDFYGRMDDGTFKSENYFGELERDVLNETITKYSNFILVSSVENTTPLVVKEALVCGLGVVVSESVGIELDGTKDFITILNEDSIYNREKLVDAINKNKNISITKRDEIRKYGIENFDVEKLLLNEYIPKLKKIIKL